MSVMHRTARIPPAGPSSSGKRLVLCGQYVTDFWHTSDPDQVTCRTCIRATTSARTVKLGRLDLDE